MWRVFFTSAIVAVVVRTAMGWCKSGKCGHFGSGGFIIWDISELASITSSALSYFPWLIFSSCLTIFFNPLLVAKRTILLQSYCQWQLLGLLEVYLVCIWSSCHSHCSKGLQ